MRREATRGMSGFYDRVLVPRIVDLTCSKKPNMRQREKLVPQASGRVLEIGFGSGLNLGFYDRDRVQRLWALEPSEEMLSRARPRVSETSIPMELIRTSAEEIPLPTGSIDTVVVTYTLCTIPEVVSALREAKRVLTNGGRLLFCEHGAAPDPSVRRWQRRLNPLWKRLGGGCNLDRPIPELIAEGGFRIAELSAMYIHGWKPASFNFWGVAVPV